MGNAQIIAVDLADAVDVSSLLSMETPIGVHPVDDLDEAIELAPVVDAALVLSSAAAAGTDPASRLGALGDAQGTVPLFAIISKDQTSRTRVYAKPAESPEWLVMGPSRDILGPVLATILSKGVSVIRVDLPDSAALRQRLGDIGFTGLIKTGAGDTSIQTELLLTGRKAIIRSTAFRSGRIAQSRRFPIGFAANPVEEARWLAEEIHRETCDLVARDEP
jgi:hypothetical protein